MKISFTASFISSVVAFIFSFLVERIPGFKDIWAKFKYKELAVAVAGLVVAFALVGLYYAGAPIVDIPEPFIWNGLLNTLSMWVAFLVASQGAYTLQADNLERKRNE